MRGLKFLFLSLVVLAAAGAGWAVERFVLKGADPLRGLLAARDHGDEHDRKILYWVAPMDPNYRRDGPGKSPMGMDLIPVYEGDEPAEPGLVRVSPVAAEAIGVRYATVERETLVPEIRTFGRVAYDEDRTRHVHVRADGWINRLEVRREGEAVRQGDLLFAYFAPDLSIAAMEYARELQRRDQRGINATRTKLRSLGVSDRQIATFGPGPGIIENIHVYAPQDGIVAAIGVAEGMFITPGTTVVSLTDLSRVWVLADVFERDMHRVRAGMTATVQGIDGGPEPLSGVVDTVFPTLRADTRTIELRLVFDNPDGELLPNAFTRVALQGDPIENVLTVPADAVIRLAETARVVRELGGGRFEPVTVTTGPRVGDRIVIHDGLAEGDRIVAAAHFLIDSEGSLQAGLDRMAAGHHGHHGMDHGLPDGASVDLVWADGKVVAVEEDRRVVTLDHAPVPELGWPRMVMDFRVGPDIPMDAFRVGDDIAFGFVQTPEGRYEIGDVRPAADHSGHH
ncbi:MAG: efflux RND transporter periplasmic adaptor subunit [Rhodospirillales bacterium]|nr:MAG: efflux RND transporter periplasmic adaptor subunit [Rhodospirillales bacterium]